VALTACGGSGGGAVATPPPPPPGNGWQSGVFLPDSTFAAQCQAPRAGTNDIQGAILDENNFLRSYSDDTYLWYREIVDQDPGLFNDPIAYFDVLRTTALSPSGQPKDRFHFTFDTEAWIQLSQSGVSSGYGAQWVLLSTTPPREIVIAYTEPNSPADAANLARGAVILEVDGFDVNTNTQQGVDALNAGLFPAAAGESHNFVIQDLGAANSRSVTMVSANVTSTPVQETQVIVTATGERVGYMVFNDHIATAEAGLVGAVNQLAAGQGIDDLILDLRYNGGGFLDIAAELAYMIAGPALIAGRNFETTQFNDKHTVTDIFDNPITPTPFHSRTLGFSLAPGAPLPVLNLPRVYVISSSGTCSASEAIINGLRGIGVEVIMIGSTTCGKPYGFFARDNCGTTYFTIQFRGVNDMNFGDYSDGFVPSAADDGQANVLGCAVQDDFTKFLGDPMENRLEVALAHQAGMGCITPTAIAPGVQSKTGVPLDAADGIVPKSIWHTNRIMRQ
jgi:C-terminal processing protease CtpA/Prc